MIVNALLLLLSLALGVGAGVPIGLYLRRDATDWSADDGSDDADADTGADGGDDACTAMPCSSRHCATHRSDQARARDVVRAEQRRIHLALTTSTREWDPILVGVAPLPDSPRPLGLLDEQLRQARRSLRRSVPD